MTDERIKEFVELCKHPAIAGKMGWSRSGDVFGGDNAEVWLPLSVNDWHPERGLIGMLTGSGINSMDLEWQPGLIDGWRVSINWYTDIHQFTGATPGIALAKAIIWQHERKEP